MLERSNLWFISKSQNRKEEGGRRRRREKWITVTNKLKGEKIGKERGEKRDGDFGCWNVKKVREKEEEVNNNARMGRKQTKRGR